MKTLSPKEVCERLNITRTTFDRLASSDPDFKTFHVRRHVKMLESDFIHWVELQKEKVAA